MKGKKKDKKKEKRRGKTERKKKRDEGEETKCIREYLNFKDIKTCLSHKLRADTGIETSQVEIPPPLFVFVLFSSFSKSRYFRPRCEHNC